MRRKEAVIIFTRIPIPGKTKTRLMPCYSKEECAKLHTYFLKDISLECEKLNRDIFVSYEETGDVNILKNIMGESKEYYPQIGDSLGDKMKNAMECVFKKGYKAVVLIGTDIPQINSAILEDAFNKLDNKDVVLGPTIDGGYYLIGSKKPINEAFKKIEYGNETVFETTKNLIENKNLSIDFTKKLNDIDEKEDILSYKKMDIKNYTTAYLKKNPKISVIIPVYNEEKIIKILEKQLEKLRDCEIVLVDGGSSDNTVEILQKKYKVLKSKKGRAAQMNCGAKYSGGDILFFLHCDSIIPNNAVSEIRRVMKKFRWGCFGIAFKSKKIIFNICKTASNIRANIGKIAFGDQGIFIDRDLFFEIGGFLEIPIMEDYQLSFDLKNRKDKMGMTKYPIYTSHRRFKNTLKEQLTVMFLMNRMRKMYRDGVSPYKLSAIYKDVR